MMRYGILASALAMACNSAVVNIDRTNSGAVDRDAQFQPIPGPDHHFISLPAYPLPNCTDTLVYDKLVVDMYVAVATIGRLDPLSTDELKTFQRIQAVLRILASGAVPGALSALSLDVPATTLLQAALEAGHQSGAKAKPVLDRVAALEATDPKFKQALALEMNDRTLAHSLAVAQQFAHLIENIQGSFSQTHLDRLRSAVGVANPAATGEIGDDAFDTLLRAATTGQFSADTVKLIPITYAGLSDQVSAARKQRFADTASDFVRLADGYAASPCAGSAKYRYFYGYDGAVSWIDRDRGTQEEELSKLACDVGSPLTPDIKCDDQHRSETTRAACPEDSCWPRPEFAFLHFSDVQIREPGAKLGGSQLSKALKSLEPSFEQDYEQDQYAMFVYDAIVETANAEIDLGNRDGRLKPDLMIHTGDSADMGLQSEFDTFMTYTNKLNVPWYQTIGNHDVLAFGNLKLSSLAADDRASDDVCNGWGTVPCTCTNLDTLMREKVGRMPDNRGITPDALGDQYFTALPMLLKRICIIHSIASDWFVMDPDKQRGANPVWSFVMSHCGGWHPKPGDGTPPPASCESLNRLVQKRYARRPGKMLAGRCAIAPGPDGGDTSRMHGFDLGASFELPPPGADRDLGYYCFQMIDRPVAGGRRVWAVVLNTNTDAGAYGVFSSEQETWLKDLLDPTKLCAGQALTAEEERAHGARIGCRDLVLVFAHHPVYALYDQQQRFALTDILTKSPNVIGFFIGHHHRSGLRTIRPLRTSGGHAKWEVMGPSVIDYPQAAREITVKSVGPLGYLEVLTFAPHGTGLSEDKIRAAEKGAMRDKCATDTSMCPDGDGRIHLPSRDVTFPRLFFKMP